MRHPPHNWTLKFLHDSSIVLSVHHGNNGWQKYTDRKWQMEVKKVASHRKMWYQNLVLSQCFPYFLIGK